MNSSWTGRAPRMLRDCHFSDGADPIERSRRAKTSDREIVGYTGKKDLADKAAYYLAHPDEREQIRRAGWERARKDHTWHKRFLDSFAQMHLD